MTNEDIDVLVAKLHRAGPNFPSPADVPYVAGAALLIIAKEMRALHEILAAINRKCDGPPPRSGSADLEGEGR